MKLTFDIKNQIITRTDTNRVISNSADYIEAEFSFSSDWDNLTKVASFKNGNIVISVPLDNNSIPAEKHLNLGVGNWKVSVEGVLSDQKIETNAANVVVKSSGSIKHVGPAPDVYQDLLVMLSELQTTAAPESVIRAAVEDFLDDNYTIVIDDAVKEEIIKQVINGPQMVDKLGLTMYAQVLPFNVDTTGWASQGMCVAKKNDVEYIVSCFIKDDDSQQVIKISNLATGAVVASKTFTNLGHANGCAYDAQKDLIYVTPGGDGTGKNYVVALNWDLTINNTHVIEGAIPYGVAVVGKYIYVLSSGPVIMTFDKMFNKVSEVSVNGVTGAVSQTLAADENFFYIPYGHHSAVYDGEKIMFESIAVFRHDGSFYKLIFADTTFEIEAIAFCDDGILVSCASLRREIIFKSNIYYSNNVYHTDTDNWINGIKFSNNVQHLYVKEDYNGFRMDGTEDYPLSDFRMIAGSTWKYATTLTVDCLSNISYHISVKDSETNLIINGNNHNFAGIYLGNNKNTQLNDMTIISANSTTTDSLLALVNSKEVSLSNVKFNGSAKYCVDNSGCNVVMAGCRFDSNPTTAVLYGRRGGTFRLQTTSQATAVTKGSQFFSADNVFDSTSLVPCVIGGNSPATQANSMSLNGASHNGKSIFAFRLKGTYNVPNTVNFADAPTLESGEAITGLTVCSLNNTYLKYTVSITSDNTNFTEKVAYLNTSTGTHSGWN